ncbi:major facilitator superfamily domain-containing protein [Amylocarpus encephaloides]|uniref:Major facilitator superfamily domain-containing protein n=1 Tax=Amylocarpus encephaloides TaxID=45428 RepID=A0A9P8C644_9HELO|nr:major facilitator superfamily domain-containing protein [Amylocarpus encephaloides]
MPSESEISNKSEATATKEPLSFWLSFLALNTTVFIVSLDSTALAVAVPRITQDLHGTTLEAFWTNISFILAIVVTQPIHTSLSDVLGRKILLYAAFFFFGLGSIVFAGLGGGGLDVLSEIILADITTLKERLLYLGLYALPIAGGGVCGPLIGAAISEFVDWRRIDWINLPIIIVSVVLSIFSLHLRRPSDLLFRLMLARLYLMGTLLFAIGSTVFALPLSWAGFMYSWSPWRTILPLVIAEPVFPYRIFSNRMAVVTLVGATAHGAVLYSILLYILFFFQAVALETPFKSAVSVLPLGDGIIGLSIFGVVDVETIIPAIGVGTLFTILTIPMTANVKNVDDMGIVAGIIVSFRLFGALVGLAICSTVFNNVFEQRISSIVLSESLEALGDPREAIGFIPALRVLDLEPSMLVEVIDAYRLSMMAVFLTLVGIGEIGLFASVFTTRSSQSKERGWAGSN